MTADYGFRLAGVLLICALIVPFCLRKGQKQYGLITAGLAILCGLAVSRLVYWLTNIGFYLGQAHDFLSLFRLWEGGYSMTGAVLGAFAGCLLASRLFRKLPDAPSFVTLADGLVPALMLFVVFERFSEEMLGQGYGLDVDLSLSPLNILVDGMTMSVNNLTVLNVGTIAGCLLFWAYLAILLTRPKAPGTRALAFLFATGAITVLSESLRQDRHMVWDFVYSQQVYFFLIAVAVVILCDKNKLRAILCSVLFGGWITALEFALDGRIRPPFEFMTANVKLSWYIVFLVVLIAYGIYGARQIIRREREMRS